jgi:putative tricarboxylic transport membrane protein
MSGDGCVAAHSSRVGPGARHEIPHTTRKFGLLHRLAPRRYRRDRPYLYPHADIGTVLDMGPGYFPLGLALILMGMGLVMVVKGLTTAGVPVGTIHLRPLCFILLSFAAFGLLVERAGLIIAILAQVGLAHFASRETTWFASVITGVVLSIASSVVFVWLLKIPVNVLP